MVDRASITQHLRHLEQLQDRLEVTRHVIRRGRLACITSRSLLEKLQPGPDRGGARFAIRIRSDPWCLLLGASRPNKAELEAETDQ